MVKIPFHARVSPRATDEYPEAERSTAVLRDDVERDLVARVRFGDERAFEELFGLYYQRMVAFAKALGATAAAEELVQDIFLNIWARRDAWVVDRSLPAYLFRAVRNRVKNEHRMLRLQSDYGAEIAREIGHRGVRIAQHGTDDQLREADLEAALARALAILTDRPRQVFLLNRREHLTYAEIAVVLGIAQKTVEMHMGRALTVLRETLADWLVE
jgi:RNA polymerase sigma-70 factor (ECF subfamily)